MKLWRIAFMMLAAFSLTSCSSDDNEEFLMDQLSGTWEQVYDEGVVAEGYVLGFSYDLSTGKNLKINRKLQNKDSDTGSF